MRHREHIDFKYGSEGYCKRVLQNDAGKFPGVSAKLTKTDDKQLLKADYDSHVFWLDEEHQTGAATQPLPCSHSDRVDELTLNQP